MIHFDKISHTYVENGKIIPSVTQIIGEFFPLDTNIPQYYFEAASLRGTALHKTLEYNDKGTLKKYDQKFEIYIELWNKFKKDKEILDIELPMTYEKDYAGTIDRVFKYKTELGERYLIVDIKTGSKLDLAPLQLHGYHQMWGINGDNSMKLSETDMMVVQLRDEKIKEILVAYNQFTMDTFNGMVDLWHYKRQNKKEQW